MTDVYFWPRQFGKSTAIKAWQEAMATGRTSGAYVAFLHSSPYPDLLRGPYRAVRAVKLPRGSSTRKRARALKWRRAG